MRTDQFDPFAPEVVADPYPFYARLRDEAPVFHHEGLNLWVLSRYADVRDGARHHDVLSSSEGVMYPRIPLPMMISMDPPGHARLRRIVARDFTPRAIEQWRPLVEGLADELLDRLIGDAASGPVDFVPAVSEPLPIGVIAAVLGIPVGDREQFKLWSDTIVDAFELPDSIHTDAAAPVVSTIMELNAYFEVLFNARRAHPENDLITALVQHEDLTPMELVWFCLLLLVAGNETTTNLLGNMMIAFTDNPEQWELLRSRPDVVPAAIEEGLRYDPPLQGLYRTAREPYGDIPVGARVLLLWASANRDERQFGPDAGEFRVERNPVDHLAFGSGIHFCLGAGLARLEIGAVLRGLATRVDSFTVAGPVERTTNPTIRGVKHLPLTFAAR